MSVKKSIINLVKLTIYIASSSKSLSARKYKN